MIKLLVSADDIMVISKTKKNVINVTYKLINPYKQTKLRYMIFSRRPLNIDSIGAYNYKLEKIDNFKYLT